MLEWKCGLAGITSNVAGFTFSLWTSFMVCFIVGYHIRWLHSQVTVEEFLHHFLYNENKILWMVYPGIFHITGSPHMLKRCCIPLTVQCQRRYRHSSKSWISKQIHNRPFSLCSFKQIKLPITCAMRLGRFSFNYSHNRGWVQTAESTQIHKI